MPSPQDYEMPKCTGKRLPRQVGGYRWRSRVSRLARPFRKIYRVAQQKRHAQNDKRQSRSTCYRAADEPAEPLRA